MPKVVVSDALAPQGLEILQKAAGLEVVNVPGIAAGELAAVLADADGLVVRSGTKVTADVIAGASQLKVIGRAGIGVDNVDVPAATQRGIAVVNTPEGNNITTAEHAIALLVALARHIPQATASMKAGKWEKNKFQGMELYNRTLGVIGLGGIGAEVARIARGIQNKILEAMAMARPVVASPQALEGLSVTVPDEALAAEDAAAFAEQVVACLGGNRPGLGDAARRAVLREYSWDARLRELDDLLGLPAGSPASASAAP